jgi:hypothetical protein
MRSKNDRDVLFLAKKKYISKPTLVFFDSEET